MCGQRCWKSAHIGRIPTPRGPAHPQGAPPKRCAGHSLAVAAAPRGVSAAVVGLCRCATRPPARQPTPLRIRNARGCPRRASASNTLPTATSTVSCSQIRKGTHPGRTRWAAVSAYRRTLPPSFSRHHSPLCTGACRCSGHACQKHPRTNTTVRHLTNAKSERRLCKPGSGRSTRQRKPSAWSARRRAISGTVSRLRCANITRRTFASLGAGTLERRRPSLMHATTPVLRGSSPPPHGHGGGGVAVSPGWNSSRWTWTWTWSVRCASPRHPRGCAPTPA